ncbi:MAG: PAS domain-containing protein [Mesorhizobium sp.]
MRMKGAIDLFQYWDRLRDGRPAPLRTDIEPADIKSLLADTFILERDARGEPIFRLAGTRICATFGRELKGHSFTSLWTARDERVVARLAHSGFEGGSVIVIVLEAASMTGRTTQFELILLPLDGGADHPRTLGAMFPMDKPFWLGADPLAECRIASLRVVDPDRDPLYLKNRPDVPVPPLSPELGGLGERPLPQRSAPRRIRHLLVIDGGRDD